MLLRIRHVTTYRYETPAHAVVQLLRLTPRAYEGQAVRKWRIDLENDGTLRAGQDAFGNITHMLTLAGPVEAVTLRVEGEVERQDNCGILRNALETFPPALFLRETDLTHPDAALQDFARGVAARAVATRAGGSELKLLHELLGSINREIVFDTDPTDAATPASEAFALRRGVCQDLTHIFIACARHLGLPARYVGGYLWRSDDQPHQDAGHAWAEAYVRDLGWVGFDPANGICPTEAHIRVSVGLDYLGAAPIRGSRYGGADERMEVAVSVDRACGTGLQQQRQTADRPIQRIDHDQ